MRRREPILNLEAGTKIHEMYEVALREHKDQFRNGSGLPYFIHVADVMKRVTEMGVYDLPTLLGAIGHDLFEDTKIHEGIVKKQFGGDVVRIIRECSHDNGDAMTRQEKVDFLATFRRKSFESCVVKLADRMSNVNDYYNDGQCDYARLYALQAYPLYWHLSDNFENLVAHFGQDPAVGIDRCVVEMTEFIFNPESQLYECKPEFVSRDEKALNKIICNKSTKKR